MVSRFYGRVSELGTRADPGAAITLDTAAQAQQRRQMTILLNKPVGYVSGQPEPGCTPAVTLIQSGEESTGENEYLVRVDGRLADKDLALLNHGLSLDGRQLKPARVEWLNDDQLRFVLREGRKRQIRRMCELVGLRVTGLKRVRIGAVRLADLPLGQWRFLRPDEVF